MTDVTTLSDIAAVDIGDAYAYVWIPGSPGTQWKMPLSDLYDYVSNRRIFAANILNQALGASEVLFAISPPVGEIWTFPANLSSSSGKKITGGTNPAASYVITLRKNGSTVGTVTIATDGTVSFATSGGASFSLTGGSDILDGVGAATTDNAVGYTMTFVATSN